MGDLWATYGIAPMKVREKRETVGVFRTRIQRGIYQLIRYNYYIFFGIGIIQYLCPQKIVRLPAENCTPEHTNGTPKTGNKYRHNRQTGTDITEKNIDTTGNRYRKNQETERGIRGRCI
jgi:hypothetical protein